MGQSLCCLEDCIWQAAVTRITKEVTLQTARWGKAPPLRQGFPNAAVEGRQILS